MTIIKLGFFLFRFSTDLCRFVIDLCIFFLILINISSLSLLVSLSALASVFSASEGFSAVETELAYFSKNTMDFKDGINLKISVDIPLLII